MKTWTINNIGSLVVFMIIVLGGGITIGVATTPGDWYAALNKPNFNPPNWIFAPVWTVIYILIAVAGWRIWLGERESWAMKTWWTQLTLNFIWSPIFFSAHRIDIALGVIVMLFIAIVAFIVTGWPRHRIAALLFVPYLLWVAFAALLNASLLYLNAPLAN